MYFLFTIKLILYIGSEDCSVRVWRFFKNVNSNIRKVEHFVMKYNMLTTLI